MPILSGDKVLIEKYASDFSIPRELAEIVARRYPEYTEAQRYLFPDLGQLHDPGSIPDISIATKGIISAARNGEGILIYTHDDVDGYTSAAVVYEALHEIARDSASIHVYPIIREQDGYILNPRVLRSYREKGVRLLLTVDFGISNEENFRIAEQEGLRTVICDHHETTLEGFPTAAVNPKRPDSKYPFRELAGVGVAYKLAQSIYQEFFGMSATEFYGLKKNLLPIVCIGTFSDRVMLRDENRVFCVHGMNEINKLDEPWANFLRQNGAVDINRIVRDVIPTLGSAAYIDPRLGIDFFVQKDMNLVADCFNKLRETDQKRRQAIDSLFSDVVSSAKVTPKLVVSVIPFSKQHYLGSVAARLRDYFKRNSIIVGVQEEKCVGELRSCDVDLYMLLYNFRNLFLDFGGHKKAAGFSMDRRNLEVFLDNLLHYLETHNSDFCDECNPANHEAEALLRRAAVGMLRCLLPFGEGNPAPTLSDGSSNFTVDNALNVIEKN
jgi:single-stranded-DNA-specific exonuclease